MGRLGGAWGGRTETVRVLALIATYNEARFITPCLEHLERQGIASYLIDNESTDDTVVQARTFFGRGLMGIETFPRLGRYRWIELLRRKAELAAELEADWFIHLDPDEFLEPIAGHGTLVEALAREDAAGFNAVNFAELVFVPTRESPEHDVPDFQQTMRWYYPFELNPLFRVIAWKKQRGPVDLAQHGGHRVEFPGRAISPTRFLMRHYICLGSAHAQRKFGGRLYDMAEVERGWHGWRAGGLGEFGFPQAADLLDTARDGLKADAPRSTHLLRAPAEPTRAGRLVWRMGDVRQSTVGGVSRVWIDIGGEPLWFESSDLELTPSLEGFVGMLLLPALALGARIELPRPVCPVWLRNIEQFLLICREWWGYAGVMPMLATVTESPAPAGHGHTACCFTGGVDSFHALLRGERPIDTLAYVHGFDIPLAETERAQSVERMLRAVALATSKRAVFLRSNAREHPVFSTVNWQRTHGSALAAMGHMLGATHDHLIIPSSDVPQADHAWGSHWRTDKLLGSAALSISSEAPFSTRLEKIGHIAGEPLFRQHVRVCWEGQVNGNCSRCEKCLRTMIVLEGLGALDQVVTFDRASTLASRIDKLTCVPPVGIGLKMWKDALELNLRDDTRHAAKALIERSEAPRPR